MDSYPTGMDIRKFFKNRGDKDREAAGREKNGNEMERGRLSCFCLCTAPDVNGNYYINNFISGESPDKVVSLSTGH